MNKAKYEAKRATDGTNRLISVTDFNYHVNNMYKRHLIAQPCTLKRSRELYYVATNTQTSPGGDNTGMSTADSDPLSIYALNIPDGIAASVYNRAYGKFIATIRNSKAALGVTLGSYYQSRQMVIDRTQKLNSLFDRIISDKRIKGLSKKDFLQRSFSGKGTKAAANYVANSHLEYVFGWVPLYKDMIESAKVFSEFTIPDVWVTGRNRGVFSGEWTSTTQTGVTKYTSDGYVSCTLGALVTVDNPNSYLANRFGLANVPSVAWDLIPWSFVVNMFGNFNQIIGAFTDLVGLRYSQANVTYTYKGMSYQQFTASASHVNPKLRGAASGFHYQKVRTLTSVISKPSLVLQLPDLSVGLGGIASALLVQKIGKIGSLLR